MSSESKGASGRIAVILTASLFALLAILIVFAVLALVATLPNIIERSQRSIYPMKYEDIVMEASEEFSVPPERIYAVIYAESSFDKDAESSVGARGLMQIMPETFDDIQRHMNTEFTYDDLFDPKVNIRAGTYYLSYLYSLLGDWDHTHAAYNAGIGNVWIWLEDENYTQNGKLTNIPYKETRNYVKKIEHLREKYMEIYFSEK